MKREMREMRQREREPGEIEVERDERKRAR